MVDIEEEVERSTTIGERFNDMVRAYGDVPCPFCNAPKVKVKNNGNGYYRCKSACKREFFLALIDEEIEKVI